MNWPHAKRFNRRKPPPGPLVWGKSIGPTWVTYTTFGKNLSMTTKGAVLAVFFSLGSLMGCVAPQASSSLQSSKDPTAPKGSATTLPLNEDPIARDAKIKEKLPGKWLSDPKDKDLFEGTTTFNKDGTGIEIIWPVGHPDRKLEVAFRWSVLRERVTTRYVGTTNSRLAGYLPLPPKIVQRVVSISDEEVVTELLEGYDNIGHKSRMVRESTSKKEGL